MILPEARVGPYCRALAACLAAGAPHDGFPAYEAGRAHLRALDPGLSGALLAPFEVDPGSGMPAWTWMERVRAEAEAAGGPEDAGAAERAARLDPELGRRLTWRRDLRAHLRGAALLPSLSTRAVWRRRQPEVEVELVHDRIEADGVWTRIRAILAGGEDLGLAAVGEGVQLTPEASALLARMGGVDLAGLLATLAAHTSGRVRRVSRGRVGPFWFPGVRLPEGVPASWGQGLALHLVWTVIGDDVAADTHQDGWVAPPGSPPPSGFRRAHHRRVIGRGAPIPGLEVLGG